VRLLLRRSGTRIAVGAAAVAVALTGCAKMDAALSQQWMTIQFSPNTTVATALHVRAACSHVQNVTAMALPSQKSLITTMGGVRFDTTNASPANLAQLQTCLQQFKSVLGVNSQSAGDEGS
jgi:hypothetical protein